MISYDEAMSVYGKSAKQDKPVFSSKMEERVATLCSNFVSGIILIASFNSKQHASYSFSYNDFHDNDYCTFFKQCVEDYLHENGYEKVAVTFFKNPVNLKIFCTITIYF